MLARDAVDKVLGSIPPTGDKSLVAVLRKLADVIEAKGLAVLGLEASIDGGCLGITYAEAIRRVLTIHEPAPEPAQAQEPAPDPREDARMAWGSAEWTEYLGLPETHPVSNESVERLRVALSKLNVGKIDDGGWTQLAARVMALALKLKTAKGTDMEWPCRGWRTSKLVAAVNARVNELRREQADPKRLESVQAKVSGDPASWPEQGDW